MFLKLLIFRKFLSLKRGSNIAQVERNRFLIYFIKKRKWDRMLFKLIDCIHCKCSTAIQIFRHWLWSDCEKTTSIHFHYVTHPDEESKSEQTSEVWHQVLADNLFIFLSYLLFCKSPSGMCTPLGLHQRSQDLGKSQTNLL